MNDGSMILESWTTTTRSFSLIYVYIYIYTIISSRVSVSGPRCWCGRRCWSSILDCRVVWLLGKKIPSTWRSYRYWRHWIRIWAFERNTLRRWTLQKWWCVEWCWMFHIYIYVIRWCSARVSTNHDKEILFLSIYIYIHIEIGVRFWRSTTGIGIVETRGLKEWHFVILVWL